MTSPKIEQKKEKLSHEPMRRERVRRVSDREDSEDIRAALRSNTASGFLAQYEEVNG